jgi:hypothetical protein
VLVGLEPDARYQIRAELLQSGCRVTVEPGRSVHTDGAGTLSMRMDDCASQ